MDNQESNFMTSGDGLDGWPAPAKLNLFLHVTGRRADGYHTLQTLFQFLDFADRLYLDVRPDGVIQRIGNPELPAVDLSVRAARLLRETTGCGAGVDIRIHKRIPAGAGLGGGSSDAATTLVVLNHLWNTGLTRSQLQQLAAQLGADVPVFVYGHAAWAEGIGERLSRADPPEACYCVVLPPVHVDTAEIFRDRQLTRNTRMITIRDFLAGEAGNDLEPVTRRRYAEVDAAVTWLNDFSPARMTGSGAAVFAEVADERQGEEIIAQLPDDFRGFVARGVNQHPLRSVLSMQD